MSDTPPTPGQAAIDRASRSAPGAERFVIWAAIALALGAVIYIVWRVVKPAIDAAGGATKDLKKAIGDVGATVTAATSGLPYIGQAVGNVGRTAGEVVGGVVTPSASFGASGGGTAANAQAGLKTLRLVIDWHHSPNLFERAIGTVYNKFGYHVLDDATGAHVVADLHMKPEGGLLAATQGAGFRVVDTYPGYGVNEIDLASYAPGGFSYATPFSLQVELYATSPGYNPSISKLVG